MDRGEATWANSSGPGASLGGGRSCRWRWRQGPHVVIELSAEEQVDRFFGAAGRRWIANWAEVAWTEADRRLQHAQRSGDARAVALYLRSMDHLDGVARPDAPMETGVVHLVVGGSESIALRTIVVRPDSPNAVVDRELRVELTIPADESARRWLLRHDSTA